MKKFLLLTAIASAASLAAVAPAMADVTAPGVITVNATTTKLCTTPSSVTVGMGEYNGTVAIGPISGAVTFKLPKSVEVGVFIYLN